MDRVLLKLAACAAVDTYPVPPDIVIGTARLGDESVGCGVLLGQIYPRYCI
jgi:hypothetical protein